MAKRTATGVLFKPKYLDRHGRTLETSKWYVRVTVPGGKTKKVPLDEDHETSLGMAMDVEKNAKAGMEPTRGDYRLRNLIQLVRDDYEVNGYNVKMLPSREKHLVDFFGNCRMDRITSETVMRYMAQRRKEGDANGTINNEVALLKRGRRLAMRYMGILVNFDVERLKENPARGGYFEPEELEAILAYCPEWIAHFVRVATMVGWRPNELSNLRVSEVDFRRQEILIPPGRTKNKDGRSFPFRTYPELQRELLAQRDFVRRMEKENGRPVEFFFCNSNGRQIKRSGYQHHWDKARVKAGYPDKLVYDARRTVVRNMEERGVPRTRAMKLVGHRTEAMYKRYAIVAKPDLERAVSRLSDEPVAAAVDRAIKTATEETDVT